MAKKIKRYLNSFIHPARLALNPSTITESTPLIGYYDGEFYKFPNYVTFKSVDSNVYNVLQCTPALESALREIPVGTLVKIYCERIVNLANGKTLPIYRVFSCPEQKYSRFP